MARRMGLWVEVEVGFVIQDRNGSRWTVVSRANRLVDLESETGDRLTLDAGARPLGTVTILAEGPDVPA